MVARQPDQIFDEEKQAGVTVDGKLVPGHTVFCNICLMQFFTSQGVQNHMMAAHAWKQNIDVNKEVYPI